MLDHRAW